MNMTYFTEQVITAKFRVAAIILSTQYEYDLFYWTINAAIGRIIIIKDWQCKAGRGRLTPHQSEDPSPTLPTYTGKEEKAKIVEEKKGEKRKERFFLIQIKSIWY